MTTRRTIELSNAELRLIIEALEVQREVYRDACEDAESESEREALVDAHDEVHGVRYLCQQALSGDEWAAPG